ncbi:MAG: hypothetical protein JWL63_3513 [Rhodocyclales bacterium]|nr:hypothetical protein [Rhodocyclales bacterium]
MSLLDVRVPARLSNVIVIVIGLLIFMMTLWTKSFGNAANVKA